MKKYHYTYVILNLVTKVRYIGVRSCDCLPEQDTSYMGSSKLLTEDIKKYPINSFIKPNTLLGLKSKTQCNIPDVWVGHTTESIGFGIKYV